MLMAMIWGVVRLDNGGGDGGGGGILVGDW